MALELFAIAITPVNEVGRYLVRKLKTEFNYLTEYNLYLSMLRQELLELHRRRLDVDEDVKKDLRELKVPRKQVLCWVERAENIEKECLSLTSNNSKNKKCRRISKKILKLIKDICDLNMNGSFIDIVHQLPSPDVVPMGPRGTVENLQSRELIVKEVLEALKDDNIRSIGVLGMGGIGKTTLVTSINNKLCVSRSIKKIIMVTVSKDPVMKIIQDKIAERLDLKLEEQDMATRAYKLYHRLRIEESVLIILDDVWKPMELGEIGLQHNSEHMPCKFIVTTRNANVCSRMEVQKVIKMDILLEDEAWTLFASKARHVDVEMPSLKPTAREIVQRCKGLPLAIVVLGSTLGIMKEELSWVHALKVLQEPSTMGLGDMMPEVVVSLKLSYDHLKNKPNVQLCFLCCSLFPVDYNISLTDLRNHGIGKGFLKLTSSLEDAHNELLYYVKILKDCCLLLDGDCKSSVKMHDVVWGVAKWIASNDEDGFLVKVGGGSKYLPESDKLHTRISYMNNEDMLLPNSLECPQLRSLLLPNSPWEQHSHSDIMLEAVPSLNWSYVQQHFQNLLFPKNYIKLNDLRNYGIGEEHHVDQMHQMPDEEPYVRYITSNAYVKIDDNSSQSSSAEQAKQSHITQTPEHVLHHLETGRNFLMKLDLNSLPSASTKLEKKSHVSQMLEQDNHKSDSTVWDNSENVVMGESTSTTTTSAHDEVWNDQSKQEHEDSTRLEVAESCSRQESSSDYTITESMKTLNAMDINIGRITYMRAVKLLLDKRWREAFMNMPDARQKDFILCIDAGEI